MPSAIPRARLPWRRPGRAARRGRLALRLLRAGLRDRRRRRRHAAHAFRAVDHRVAADRRHAAAAVASGLGERVREVPAPRPSTSWSTSGMALDEFKRIFWWEYAHRLLGRLIGVVFLVPFLWFLARREIPPGYGWQARRHLRARRAAGRARLVHGEKRAGRRSARVAVPADRASGSRVRDLRRDVVGRAVAARRARRARPAHATRSARALVDRGRRRSCSLMVLTGGFVAGIRAGFAYNTFPLMNGSSCRPRSCCSSRGGRTSSTTWRPCSSIIGCSRWSLAFVVPLLWWQVRARRRAAAARARRRASAGRHAGRADRARHRDAAAGRAAAARGRASGGRRAAVRAGAASRARAAVAWTPLAL